MTTADVLRHSVEHTHENLAARLEGARAMVGTREQPRKALEDMVSVRWQKNGPRRPAEVVASAAALAFNDAHTTGKLHPHTKTALERMWTLQRPDGGWDWIKCNWPQMENDDHSGVTLAALGFGVAPDGYDKTPTAQKGLAGIRAYFA